MDVSYLRFNVVIAACQKKPCRESTPKKQWSKLICHMQSSMDSDHKSQMMMAMEATAIIVGSNAWQLRRWYLGRESVYRWPLSVVLGFDQFRHTYDSCLKCIACGSVVGCCVGMGDAE